MPRDQSSQSLEEGEIREDRRARSISRTGKLLVEHFPRAPRDPLRCYQDPHSRYEPPELLAIGGQAACLRLQRREDQRLLVCKVSTRVKNEEVPREVEILRDILPPNDRIIKVCDVLVTPSSTQIYFDYFNGGDLSDFIGNHVTYQQAVPESFIWHALLQLAEAVAFLHYGYDRNSQRSTQRDWIKVIHRDIKPANIFLRTSVSLNAYPSLVLADFGLASLRPTSSLCGSFDWQPPEIPLASLAGDCWAVGAVIHAMALDGEPPLDVLPSRYPDNRRIRELWSRSPNSRKVWPISPPYTNELEDCMFGALTLDPWNRFNALEILEAAVSHYETIDTAYEPIPIWAYTPSFW